MALAAQCTSPTAGSTTCNTLSSVTIGGIASQRSTAGSDTQIHSYRAHRRAELRDTATGAVPGHVTGRSVSDRAVRPIGHHRRQWQTIDRCGDRHHWRQNAHARQRQPNDPERDRRSCSGRPDHRRPDLHDHRDDPATTTCSAAALDAGNADANRSDGSSPTRCC